MPPLGRPRLLEPAKCREICELAALGYNLTDVARVLGYNVKTIRRHLQRDECFRREFRAAQLAARTDPLKTLRRKAGRYWRAAAWLLERTSPESFAKRPPRSATADEVAESFAVLIDAAVDHIDDRACRRKVHLALKSAAATETKRLFGKGFFTAPEQSCEFTSASNPPASPAPPAIRLPVVSTSNNADAPKLTS